MPRNNSTRKTSPACSWSSITRPAGYARQVTNGVEVVQVLEPDVEIVAADVGARLLPVDGYWANVDGINGILPNVTEGINDTAYV